LIALPHLFICFPHLVFFTKTVFLDPSDQAAFCFAIVQQLPQAPSWMHDVRSWWLNQQRDSPSVAAPAVQIDIEALMPAASFGRIRYAAPAA
jgi:hypothetical protein